MMPSESYCQANRATYREALKLLALFILYHTTSIIAHRQVKRLWTKIAHPAVTTPSTHHPLFPASPFLHTTYGGHGKLQSPATRGMPVAVWPPHPPLDILLKIFDIGKIRLPLPSPLAPHSYTPPSAPQ